MKVRGVAGLLLVIGLSSSVALSQAESAREEPRPDSPAVETIRGEVVVRSYQAELVIAIDEADAEGNVDGKVDQLLYMPVMDLLITDLSLRDPAAEVQVRRYSVRTVLPTEGKDLSFHMLDTRESLSEVQDKGLVLDRKRYREGLNLLRFRGEKVSELTLQEVERGGPAVVKAIRPPIDFSTGDLITPLNPPADPDDGGTGCKSSCSTSCGGGSCAAACMPGHCAYCKCIDRTPSCYCI